MKFIKEQLKEDKMVQSFWGNGLTVLHMIKHSYNMTQQFHSNVCEGTDKDILKRNKNSGPHQ